MNLKIAEFSSHKLEYFKSLSFESDELTAGHHVESVEPKSSKEKIWREWIIQDVSSSLKKVEIVIYFESNPQKRAQVALLLSRRLDF